MLSWRRDGGFRRRDLHGYACAPPISVDCAVVSFTDATIARLPRPIRPYFERHHELIKFAIVGATTFVIDSAVFYTLKLTVLEPKPVTAKIIAGIVAVIASYILNREWSFRDRGGRERHHEALLFFGFSGVGVLSEHGAAVVLQLRAAAARARSVADRGEHRRLHLGLHHRQPAADGRSGSGRSAAGCSPTSSAATPTRRSSPRSPPAVSPRSSRTSTTARRHVEATSPRCAARLDARRRTGSARRFLRAQGVEDFVIQQ